jgi:hypothetical protein
LRIIAGSELLLIPRRQVSQRLLPGSVEGMANGMFRQGHSLERYVPRNGQADFYNARWIMNGNTRHERRVARRLFGYADDYLNSLNGCGFAE